MNRRCWDGALDEVRRSSPFKNQKLCYLPMTETLVSRESPKYRQVFQNLLEAITSGIYGPGQKLPSEAALVRKFGASRITIGHAVRELKDQGLVYRIAGSGTYVRRRAAKEGGALFGLLIPDLGETEIFEPICQGMAGAPQASQYALLWGGTGSTETTKEQQAMRLCEQFIERRVSGVFFAPLKLVHDPNDTNQAIVAALDKAQIPVILLDRCILPFPHRSHYDLVGINNRRAGYRATEHLLSLGCRRIVFITDQSATSTVAARIAGFHEAMLSAAVPLETSSVQGLDAVLDGLAKQTRERVRPEAFVCVNDRTAGHLMQALLSSGYRVPQDFKIVGIDDVEYAKLLPVPLTTIHQPCREIGRAAITAMLDRIANPDMLTRDILLDCKLVVRASSGA